MDARRKRGRKPQPRRRAKGDRRLTNWVVALAATVIAAALFYAVWPKAAAEPAEGSVASFPDVHGLAVDPHDPDVLWVGSHGLLIKVTDRTQWTRVGRAHYDLMGFNVHPVHAGVLLTSGHPGPGDPRPNPLGVEISRDGGQTWTPLALAGQADFHSMSISPADPNVIYAWSVTGQAGFYRSRAGGRTWELVVTSALQRVFALAASPARAHEVFAGTASGLLRSTDGGVTWSQVSPRLTGLPVTAVAVHRAHPSVIYAYVADPQAGLLRSTDAGKTWTPLGLYLGARDAVAHLALHPIELDALYYATFGNDLFWTTDAGKTRIRLARAGQVVQP